MPRVQPNSPIIVSFDLTEFSLEKCSIFNNFTIVQSIVKPTQCTPTHQGLSDGTKSSTSHCELSDSTKSPARGAMVWEISM